MGILFRAKYKEEPYCGGKYFRIVGRLIADGVDISDLLIHRLNPDGSLNTATDRLKDPL